MSIFRLELATEKGVGLTWKLFNGIKHVVWSAGPSFGDCDLPWMDCYEFAIINMSTNNMGTFTVFAYGEDDSKLQWRSR